MANTIKNFLVGVGLDTKDFDAGQKDVTDGLGRIRSVAGFAGAAMVGAFATASAAAINAGNRVDKLALSTERFNTSTSFVYNYGNALRVLGGDASEAVQAISSAETALANLQLQGELGPLAQTVFAGADVGALMQAATGEEFLRMLAEQVPEMTKNQQMIIQDALGFSDATMRSLRMGGRELDQLVTRVSELTGNIDGFTESARQYNAELAQFQLRLEGISNTLGERMLPAFAGILTSLNGFIDQNGETIVDTASTIVGMQTPARMLYNYARGDEDAFSSWSFAGRGISNAWDATKSGVSDFVSGARNNAIERSSAYRDSVRGGTVDGQEAIRATPDYNFYHNRNETMNAPAQKIENNLDIKLEIDGQFIDTRATNVIERRERATIDDIQSTTVR